jgi:hypothetical protein
MTDAQYLWRRFNFSAKGINDKLFVVCKEEFIEAIDIACARVESKLQERTARELLYLELGRITYQHHGAGLMEYKEWEAQAIVLFKKIWEQIKHDRTSSNDQQDAISTAPPAGSNLRRNSSRRRFRRVS